jgi:purine-binding chemotaxis protein CheW
MVDQALTNKILRYIRCTAGDETFALDMDAVYSIQRSDNLRLDPMVPHAIGWFPLREAQVPVYLLSERLGMGKNGQTAAGRVVLMSPLPGQVAMWGLAVDQVSQVFITNLEALSPLQEALCTESDRYFSAVLRQADDLYLMLEPASLHPDKPVSAAPKYCKNNQAAPSPASSDQYFSRVAVLQTQQKQLIVFSLPGLDVSLQFGLSITQVLEILAPLSVIGLPGAPDYILGLVNWRDRPVPLVDLPARLGLESHAENGSPRLMIVRDATRKQDQIFGFMVRPNIQMLRLPIDYRSTGTKVKIPKIYVKGVVEIQGQITILPDISKVISN